ncbi:MAG: hypothetical protein LBO66_00965 [Deltaproteobacteria bacterium]|jgi:hypothetical protein|nr:hypothetical protein [Deltaproteobacteria bacterium]
MTTSVKDPNKPKLTGPLPADENFPRAKGEEYVFGSLEFEITTPLEHKYTLSLRRLISTQEQDIKELKKQGKKLTYQNKKISGLENANINLMSVQKVPELKIT